MNRKPTTASRKCSWLLVFNLFIITIVFCISRSQFCWPPDIRALAILFPALFVVTKIRCIIGLQHISMFLCCNSKNTNSHGVTVTSVLVRPNSEQRSLVRDTGWRGFWTFSRTLHSPYQCSYGDFGRNAESFHTILQKTQGTIYSSQVQRTPWNFYFIRFDIKCAMPLCSSLSPSVYFRNVCVNKLFLPRIE